MKKLYFSLLSVALGLSLNAQTLTQTNHAFANGDMFSTYQMDSTNISPGASGAGATWNFASVATRSSVVNNYSATTSSNANYPSAGVVVASSTANPSFYSSTSTDMKYWGGNLVVGGIPATINYTSAAVQAAYPMGLNTAQSAVTGGSLVVLGNNGTFTGNSNVILDGIGTLNTPGGSFLNALRVVTSQTINFAAGIATGAVTQVNYDYYASGTKAPMFTISTSSLTSNIGAPSQQTVVTRYKALSTGINSVEIASNEVLVYPNPSTTYVNFVIENKNAVFISVYDINGKLIENKSFNGSLKLDVSNYSNGIYTYKITAADNSVLKSAKFSVAH